MTEKLRVLFAALDALDGPPPLDYLMAQLASCSPIRDELEDAIRFSEATYTRSLVRDGAGYQAWVLAWLPGQHSPIHDHAGSACAVRVVAGQATETQFILAANGTPRPTGTHVANPGEVLGGQNSDVHRIANLGDTALITLHVYAPPLLRMNVWPDPAAVDSPRPW